MLVVLFAETQLASFDWNDTFVLTFKRDNGLFQCMLCLGTVLDFSRLFIFLRTEIVQMCVLVSVKSNLNVENLLCMGL